MNATKCFDLNFFRLEDFSLLLAMNSLQVSNPGKWICAAAIVKDSADHEDAFPRMCFLDDSRQIL